MRRKDREVTDFSRMLEILYACDCCRLGLVDGGEAYIVPMNFGIAREDGNLVLYFHAAKEGRKIDLLKSSPWSLFRPIPGTDCWQVRMPAVFPMLTAVSWVREALNFCLPGQRRSGDCAQSWPTTLTVTTGILICPVWIVCM